MHRRIFLILIITGLAASISTAQEVSEKDVSTSSASEVSEKLFREKLQVDKQKVQEILPFYFENLEKTIESAEKQIIKCDFFQIYKDKENLLKLQCEKANLLYEQKKFPEAIQEWQKVIELSQEPTIFEEKQGLIKLHFEKGNLLYQEGKLQEAIQEWQKVLELSQDPLMQEYIKAH
jgi:tetratricopeptide (TPR) repeat protein